MIFLAVAFTVFAWISILAIVCGLFLLGRRLVRAGAAAMRSRRAAKRPRRAAKRSRRAAKRSRRASAALPDDWWEQFERDFRIYTSRPWRAAREAERQR